MSTTKTLDDGETLPIEAEGEMGGLETPENAQNVSGNQVATFDLEAIKQIREILGEFYPEVRKAILEYCLFITEKDLEA